MWRNPNHPVWALARHVIYLTALCLILWINAKRFDITEVKSLAQMFLTAIGIEGGLKIAKTAMRKDDSN